MKKLLFILLSILIVSPDIYAGFGTKRFSFLRFSPSPRANALVDAYSAVTEDVSGIFYNPAGVYSVYPMEFYLHYIKLYESMNYFSAAGKYKIHKLGDISVGFSGLLFGDIPGISQVSGELVSSGRNISPASYQGVLNYSRMLLYRWMAGISVKVVHEKLDEHRSTVPNIDLGTIYKLSDFLNIGVTGRNLHDQGDPLTISAGLGSPFIFRRFFMNQLLLTADAEKTAGVKDLSFGAGAELGFFNIFFVRAGYRIGKNIDDPLRLGAGIGYQGISVDFSYLMHRELDSVLSVGVKYRLGHEIFTIKQEGKEERIRLSEDSILLFEFNRTDISLDGKQVLNEIGRYISDTGYDLITINGYTDNIGGSAHNLALSEKRAKAVYDFLNEEGLDPEKMRYKGYGQKDPVADNDTEDGRSRNRRCEILIQRRLQKE